MKNGENKDGDCRQSRKDLEESSDSNKMLDDKRKEMLYSAGGGRKTDFGETEIEPPHCTENESKM